MASTGDQWRWNIYSHRIPQSGYRIDVIDAPAVPRRQPYGFAPPQPVPAPFPPQIAARRRA